MTARLQALELANERRRERADFHAELQRLEPQKAREHVARLLMSPSQMLLAMELTTLLGWLPGLGRRVVGGRGAVVDWLFEWLGVRQVDKRVGDLSGRQLGLLIGWLEGEFANPLRLKDAA